MALSAIAVSFGCESTPACGDSCDCSGDDALRCAPSHCENGAADGDESDLDCGGSCAACGDEFACNGGSDCESGACVDSACAAPSCDDGVHNGDELAVDCGGSCSACTECESAEDCAEGDCVDGACVSEPNGNGGAGGGGSDGGVEAGGSGAELGGSGGDGSGGNGASGGTDAVGGSGGTGGSGSTGGSGGDGGTGGAPPACTSDCPLGAACSGPGNCASGVCTGNICRASSCGDGFQNGAETALDCGGGCAGCARGAACLVDADCASVHCIDEECVIGPTANFDIDTTPGAGSFFVEVSPDIDVGDAAIASVQYSFGDGAGFAATASHTYVASGTFTITQLVTDANGLTDTATRSVTVNLSGFAPVLLNDEDRSDPEVQLSADRLGMEVIDDGAFVGVRSNRAVAPGTGMFYFEGQRFTDTFSDMYFGIAPASLPLDELPGGTAGDHAIGLDIAGQIWFNGASVDSFDEDFDVYGFVLDYRAASPIVHVIVNDNIVATTPMVGVTEQLYIFVGGRRREVGEQARINTGNDTQNFPFVYDAVDALNDDGLPGASLVLGWGQTHAEPANARPSLVSISGNTTISFGQSVNLTATVSDTDDAQGALSVHWVDLATTHATPEDNDGLTWQYSPDAIGIHPILVTVTDPGGRSDSDVVDVTVTGTLPQFDPVRLVDEGALTGDGIQLDASGLRTRYTANAKYGIRANQGMIGEFRYFEIRRLIPPNNQGGGLVIAEGNLNPYSPVDIPPSCSINTSASVWRNLISEANYDTDATEYYGFAVDYRGRHPIVYVITHEGDATPRDVVSHEMLLDDVTVPIYPMLYGNPTEAGAPFDAEINFGATPFHYDPASVLGSAANGLVLGWGDANRP